MIRALRYLNFKKSLRGMALALLFVLPVFTMPALALSTDGIDIQSDPEPGQTVYAGDKITYSVSLNAEAEAPSWSWVKITMGDGLRLVEESALVSGASAVSLPATAADESPEQTPVYREIIPGNNGLVLLASAIVPGDTLTFYAYVQEAGDLTVSAATANALEAAISHTLGEIALPDQTPVFAYFPPEPPQENGNDGLIIALVVLISALVGAGFFLAKKRRQKNQNPPL